MDAIVQADARQLPFADASFDVAVADPPYETIVRHRRKVNLRDSGYVPFAGRDWWAEAWRVLRPGGSLYVYALTRELPDWYGATPIRPVELIAWVNPGLLGLQLLYQGGSRLRSQVWLPILHWQKPPPRRLDWTHMGEAEPLLFGRPLRRPRPAAAVDPNVYVTNGVNPNHPAYLPYPHQLPEHLLRWLLRPHRGARVLDLFSGTGTTRAAAIGLKMEVVSVELNARALPLIQQRPAQHELF